MNRIYLTIGFFLSAMGLVAQQVTKLSQGIMIDNGAVHARVQFLTDDIARVEKSPSGEYCEPQSVVVTLAPQKVKTRVKEDAFSVTIASSKVKVVVGKQTGRVDFQNVKGNTLLKEKAFDFKQRGSGPGKEGEPVYDALVKAVRMRYTLIPYIYSTAHDVNANNGSFMRALVSDFKSDRKTWSIGNEYMFGKSLLVAPIVKAQYTPEKAVAVDAMSGWDKQEGSSNDGLKIDPWTDKKQTEVYLPEGAQWFNYWTNEKVDGGRTLTLTTTLDYIPLFVRAGSILPIGEVMQYVDEKPADNLEIKIYPGADGDFTLYEDEGDSYDYEKGAFATIDFHWDDKSKTLTLGKRKGSYNGMIAQRKFNVKLMGSSSSKSVSYKGAKINVKL